MGESRTELLAWVNDLLQINYTKVEQAGTGAAYCQIMDSIFGDVHMSKVKFETKHEYEYVANFKVLQHTFDKHKVDKVIPVDRLMKCKFQDNLEFMQWVKRFWDQNFPGGAYDALQRRKGGAPPVKTVRAGGATAARRPAAAATARSTSRTTAMSGRGSSASASGNGLDHHSSSMIIELNKQISELKMSVDSLEKERDFYFGKLRDIEIMVQEQLELAEGHDDAPEYVCLKEIQTILYSTEEGFEIPPEGEEGLVADEYDDETF
ncbi:calponin homology domain-containing protein [Radiomyces spectabilis]|uniref:calponin homology domain-containing protein n=1 Tax=Radiomyces spectabilis TaxID=64574 RepID=UPI00221F26C0|nr:calponin homology domain-containing protein [Radiomyces spectabilis]KAI8372925.1 calponin homology domain-containing protein [Radiomyces spectabilis]